VKNKYFEKIGKLAFSPPMGYTEKTEEGSV